MTFPMPINEDARLNALEALQILDTPEDSRFNRIVRLAAAYFAMPVVRLTFVDRDRTWFKAAIGMQIRQAPREISICSRTILSDAVLVIPDLTQDPSFANSPQVAGRPHFRFYAGAPIILDSGYRVGSVCLMDYQPHFEFGPEQQEYLTDLAAVVVHELDLHAQLADRTEELRDSGAALDLAKNARSRFLSIASHELKTPLNSIMGFGQLLKGEGGRELSTRHRDEFINHILGSARRLNHLIDRILTYASAETGEIRLIEEEFAWRDLLRDCLQSADLIAQERMVAVDLFVADGAPHSFYGDKFQIHEVVTQIVCNAIAFSRPNSQVNLHLERDAGGGVRVTCFDQGKGMDPQTLARVMGPFEQADATLVRTHEGIGLGLPLSKAITELHGGNFHIESSLGEGTSVALTFPATRNR